MTGPAGVERSPLRLPREALPSCLRDTRQPPNGLWLLGDRTVLDAAAADCVAIVGTREASAYGIRTARRLAAAAARAGLVVVSGMARGVDAAAHEACMEAGGRTIAVLGTGVDVPYPVGHRTLHRAIQDAGAVISEQEPGTRAFPGCFPRRNRLIASLASTTIVVEAGFKSGAINTASQANELSKNVAAVPGPIDDPRSAGANHLIRDGAHIVASVEDMLALCGKAGLANIERGIHEAPDHHPVEADGSIDRSLLGMLGSLPMAADDLAFSVGLPLKQVANSLVRLELSGLARFDGAGYSIASG
ncbi:MAG: DNA-processing protein DprA [Gemmatimonadaceae bacterium]|nr:DNA-processing protein DprA [Gemmatimonadaceae bacterium]